MMWHTPAKGLKMCRNGYRKSFFMFSFKKERKKKKKKEKKSLRVATSLLGGRRLKMVIGSDSDLDSETVTIMVCPNYCHSYWLKMILEHWRITKITSPSVYRRKYELIN